MPSSPYRHTHCLVKLSGVGIETAGRHAAPVPAAAAAATHTAYRVQILRGPAPLKFLGRTTQQLYIWIARIFGTDRDMEKRKKTTSHQLQPLSGLAKKWMNFGPLTMFSCLMSKRQCILANNFGACGNNLAKLVCVMCHEEGIKIRVHIFERLYTHSLTTMFSCRMFTHPKSTFTKNHISASNIRVV